jgi:hypothetical protein
MERSGILKRIRVEPYLKNQVLWIFYRQQKDVAHPTKLG